MSSSKQTITSHSHKQQPINVLMCGLNAAGKTSVLHVMKYGEVGSITPNIGVDFQTVIIGDITMRGWDVGGRSSMRLMQRSYHQRAEALIFVVDSHDRNRIDEACEELHRMTIEDALKHKPILILANKQDLPDAMTLDEIRDKLNLAKLNENIKWHLQAACAIENDGIKEGFEWLANTSVTKNDFMQPIIETLNDSTMMKNNLLSTFSLVNLKKLWNKFVEF